MLLGKRPRPPMRRTTSMTGITVDLNNVEGEEPTDVHAAAAAAAAMVVGPQPGPAAAVNNNNNNIESMDMKNNFGYHEQHRFLAMLSPRNNHRTNSAAHDVVETAHFLRTCGLCKRHLASGRDIYMYR